MRNNKMGEKIILTKIIITNLAILFFITCKAQNRDSIEIIKDINQEIKKIDIDINKCKRFKQELEGESAEGGELTIYYNGNDVKKFFTVFYGESGKSTIEYYLKNKKLIFIMKKVFYYDKMITQGAVKINRKEIDKYYVYNNKLIAVLNEKNKKLDIKKKLSDFEFYFKDVNNYDKIFKQRKSK